MPQAKRRAKPKRVKRVLNGIPSRDTEQDWQIEHADAAGCSPRRPRPDVEGPA